MVSTPAKRANGKTASLTAIWSYDLSVRPKDFSGTPAMTLAAMAAMGWPMVLATKGAVRLARGFTSSTKMRGSALCGSSIANCTFIRPRTFRALAISVVCRFSSATVSADRE